MLLMFCPVYGVCNLSRYVWALPSADTQKDFYEQSREPERWGGEVIGGGQVSGVCVVGAKEVGMGNLSVPGADTLRAFMDIQGSSHTMTRAMPVVQPQPPQGGPR